MKKLFFLLSVPCLASVCCQQSIPIETFEYTTTANGIITPHDIFYDMPNYYCFTGTPFEYISPKPPAIINPPYVPPVVPKVPAVPEPNNLILVLPILLGIYLFRRIENGFKPN